MFVVWIFIKELGYRLPVWFELAVDTSTRFLIGTEKPSIFNRRPEQKQSEYG